MSVLVPWLPANAIAEAARTLQVRETVADWSAKWLGSGSATLSGTEAAARDLRISGTASELDDGLALVIPEDVSAIIGRMMFGIPEGEPTAADFAAISASADTALADLRQRLAQLVGLPRQAGWRECDGAGGPGHLFRVRLGQALQPLVIIVSDSLLVLGIKARLRPDPASTPLGALSEGLAPQTVMLSALLGSCRLSTRELAELGAGDVVVLDRGLNDVVPIAIDGIPQTVGCRVAASDANLVLTLV
jgi:flagellar motor switch/type III secretory pathway protein FliN